MARLCGIGLVASAIVWGFASAAAAEGRPTQIIDHRPHAKATALELELGLSTGRGRGTTFTPHLDLRQAFSEHAEITLDWPIWIDIVSGNADIASGDPSAVLYYMNRGHDGYFRLGGGVAFPLAPYGLPIVAAMNGLRDAWSYAPKTLSLLFPAQFEIQRSVLVLGGDFAAAALIPTGGGGGRTEVALQLAGLLGARISKTTLGARLQGAWLPRSAGDNAQLALVPFVQGDFSDGGFVYARLLLNLDPPFGPFTRTGGVWALFIGGGSRL